ncbi:acetyl-CoA synthetase-like protein [Laetiporus sulphureus 93-53]|uniref:Acetyl-CoA synthetase-like protein n=1 Tax=Laetiporus sulphureus 93-53 TaxID=1314785 RepID=A0A165ER17_9APHY|nr:acetyl-CoA synthetase-like protein [Laetiporus sulphureus 93-53]KZT07586.1 acetyl-CoA synthetase-like protein [Laetiporus sulphureus 93-53]
MTVITRPVLPPCPQIHGRSSTTFKLPPLEGSLTLPELFDWQAQNSPSHRVFTFADDDGETRDITWREAARGVHTGAKLVRSRLGSQPGIHETPVIAILATSDGIPYFTMMISIMRAGYAAFLISSRNSSAAVAHLISQVGVKHLFVGPEPSMEELAGEVMNLLKTEYPSSSVPNSSSLPLFEELYLPSSTATVDVPYQFKGANAPALILHSSGSTAFPKPIVMSNQRVLEIVRSPCYGERDLCGVVFSLHSTPMFHAMGVMIAMWGPAAGITYAFFKPKSPPTVPSPDLTIQATKATQCDIIAAVPAMIEMWSRVPEYVDYFKTRQGLIYGGGPLSKEVGDFLASEGITIFNLYGSTEGGPLTVILLAEVGMDWEYFKLPDCAKAHMIPQDDGSYEFILMTSDALHPAVLNADANGVPSYATSDLLIRHPTKPGFWKIHGRTDDQIMHSTGEKTNPGPLEAMMNQDPHVHASIIFGRGRFQAGILVDPKREYQFDPSDEKKLAEFRNKIWPTVEKMNEFAPQHSRLFKEMIMVSKPSKPFAYTAKDTVRRGVVLKEYDQEINDIYDLVEKSAQSNVPPPEKWDLDSAAQFVRAVVGKIMTHKVTDSDDLFQHGCDSLQATYIRNALLRGLQETAKIDTRKIVGNFVYDHPTVSSLASFVSGLALGTVDGKKADSPAARINAMHAMVAKYTSDFPAHKPNEAALGARPHGDVVFVTGTTGSLGCHLLSQMAANPEVAVIYGFNRPARNQIPLFERQKAALADRGLDASILNTPKVVLLEGELAQPYWGLPEETYDELHRTVTHIIHNAWRVDFVINLSSFESSIAGVRSLVDFALTSPLPEPPRVLFESSMGVFQNAPDLRFAEEPILPDWALGTGYAESKWVSEQIMYAAGKKTVLDPLVVRVGQVCGGLDGTWNAHEWYPSLVQSAPRLGCFPDDHKGINFIPLDITTSAIIDFRKAPYETGVVHLVHPNPVSWHSLAEVVAQEFNVELVPFPEYVVKLEEVASSVSGAKADAQGEMVRSLRALHLLPFYRGLAEKGSDTRLAIGFGDLDVTRAVKVSPTLGDPNLRQLGAEDVKRWIAYWHRVGQFSGEPL